MPIWVCPLFYVFCKYTHLQYAHYFKKTPKICPFAIWQGFQKSIEIWPFTKIIIIKVNFLSYFRIVEEKFGIKICVKFSKWAYLGIAHLQWYSHFLVIFKNMPNCNMPIFLKIHKYAHLWYLGIFQYRSMPNKNLWPNRRLKDELP